MKQTNLNAEYIKTVCEYLDKESVELIDFDALKKALSEAANLKENLVACISELENLKTEYRDRILGMLKANIALKEDPQDLEMVARLSGDLSGISSEDLIKLQAATTCRFRRNFPASFKYLTPSNPGGRDNNWTDYKI